MLHCLVGGAVQCTRFPVMKEEAVNKVGRTGGGQKHTDKMQQSVQKRAQFLRHIPINGKNKPNIFRVLCPMQNFLCLCSWFHQNNH